MTALQIDTERFLTVCRIMELREDYEHRMWLGHVQLAGMIAAKVSRRVERLTTLTQYAHDLAALDATQTTEVEHGSLTVRDIA